MRIVLLGLMCVVPNASADIFKCTLPGGRVEYRAAPCASGKPTALPIAESPPAADDPASAPRTAGVAPEIVGSERFQARVWEAFALLKVRDPGAFAIATGYIGRIAQAGRSGMRADVDPPTFLLSDADAMFSVTWAAAVIAHDSYHSKLYFDYRASHAGQVPPQAWGGTQAEIKCNRHQLAVMRQIGSSPWEIDHTLLWSDGHHVNDWDYQQRPSR